MFICGMGLRGDRGVVLDDHPAADAGLVLTRRGVASILVRTSAGNVPDVHGPFSQRDYAQPLDLETWKCPLRTLRPWATGGR